MKVREGKTHWEGSDGYRRATPRKNIERIL